MIDALHTTTPAEEREPVVSFTPEPWRRGLIDER